MRAHEMNMPYDEGMLQMAHTQHNDPGYALPQQMRAHPGLVVKFELVATRDERRERVEATAYAKVSEKYELARSAAADESDEALAAFDEKNPRPEAPMKMRFRDAEYVRIASSADRNSVICREVTPQDKAQYAHIYAAWKAKQDQILAQGTPLFVLVQGGILKPSQAEELKANGTATVEMLAAMADNETARYMGGQALKRKAMEWLDVSKADAPLVAQRKVNEDLQHKLTALEQQCREQMKLIERFERSTTVADVKPTPTKK